MPSNELLIFSETFDLLSWLLVTAQKFPRPQRFVVTKRLQDAALDFHEALFDANAQRGAARADALRMADAHLNKLRAYLRLVHQMGWLSDRQYEHVSERVARVGRLLGGWIRQTHGA